MRKILPLLFTIFLLASCGPHRMRCGARGICKAPEKQLIEKPEKVPFVKA
ncbi:hypothetical protein [Flavobacterium degerlachei]|jgi:hypothetical protein|uniref:Lipoprotein n=1 Tax=Flavobacterium degerlachei TaxID=229203 RepID=A0A1H3B7L6_9FLAO|nr:hypothetical protein [Flavobacterium degerlachei]SDX37952.1 hypothetical protein SAMN05444338_109179 [Flavobacterium degerlachei]